MKALLIRFIHLPKKYLFILALVILSSFYFFFNSNDPAVATLEFQTVKKEDIKVTISASGILTGKDSSSLKFKSAGRLAYLNVKPGDSVSQGQVLAGLNTADLNIALQQAQNSLREKQAIVDRIEDDLKNHSSDESFVQRQTRTAAQVARDNAYDDVKSAQRAFQDSVIVSPINGIVVSQDEISPGQNIGVSDLIAQVVDFSELYFQADIDESDISKVNVGQLAEVKLNSYPDRSFAGKVSQVLPQTKISSSGAVTVTVKVLISDSDVKPIYGLNGEVEIIEQSRSSVLTIPQSALLDDKKVIVKTSTGLEVREVTVGIEGDFTTEISSGLSENQEIAINPTAKSIESIGNKGFFAKFRSQK